MENSKKFDKNDKGKVKLLENKVINKLCISLYQDFSMVDNHLYKFINKWIESIQKSMVSE